MADWATMVSYLLDEIVPLCDQKNFAKQWLSSLNRSHDAERLALCIAIDIKSEALASSIYANLIDMISATDGTLASFMLAREKHSSHLRPLSNYSQEQCDDWPKYVRVITIADFIKYYAGPSLGYTFSEVDEVREVFFYEKSSTLEDITTAWSGANNRIWVLPLEDLETAMNIAHAEGDPGTGVNDLLGLGKCTGIGKDNKP